mgnify:CR=1 FL=1
MNLPPNPRFLLAPLLLALLGSSSMVQAADAKASKYYEDALIRYEKIYLNGAVILIKNELQIDKELLPVQMLLGKVLLLSSSQILLIPWFNFINLLLMTSH